MGSGTLSVIELAVECEKRATEVKSEGDRQQLLEISAKLKRMAREGQRSVPASGSAANELRAK